MSVLLYLIPLFAVVSGVLLYRHNGKREILKLDLVQFFYAFVIAPLFFVWLKSLVYLLIRKEMGASLSSTAIFVYDTAFSVIALYVFAFVVIHAVTASFQRKMLKDPLHDIFAHSEFFHLWLTHIVMYTGAQLILSVVAALNLFFPLELALTAQSIYLLCTAGIVTGVFGFLGVWLSDPKQDGANFMRLMKVLFGFFFILHVVAYFVITPGFDTRAGVFWFSFFFFSTLVGCSLFVYRSERAQTLFERLSTIMKFKDWGENIQLFKHK